MNLLALKSKIEEKWDDILGNKIYNFKIGVRNIIKWFPIIWEDRDWDHRYFFTMMKQKLYFMAQLHIRNQRYVGWERNVEYMTTCIKLIDYITEEHYSEEMHDVLDEKYGKGDFKFIPVNDGTGNSFLEIEHENILNGKYTQEEYDKEFMEKMAEARNKHDRAKKLLFRILNERIEWFWD